MFDYMQLGWQWRFSTLAINPSTPDMLYAGTTGGGVFVAIFSSNVFLPVILRS